MTLRPEKLLDLLKKRNPFTVTGRLLALATTFSFFAIVDSSLVGLLSNLVWLLIVAFVFGMLFRPRLELRAQPLPLVHNGEEFPLRLSVVNIGSFSAYDLQCQFTGEPQGFRLLEKLPPIEAIEPGQCCRLTVRAQAIRRGLFDVPSVLVVSLFPLGLFRFLSLHPLKQSLLVAPALTVDAGMAAKHLQNFDLLEATGRHRANAAEEYIGSREFQPGMAVRRWDFASWARMGKPAVREFSESQESCLVLLVDVMRNPARLVDPNLEAVLSAAAGILQRLSADGMAIQMVLARPSPLWRDGADHLDPRDAFMRELAMEQGVIEAFDWSAVCQDILSQLPLEVPLLAVLAADNQPAHRACAALRAEGYPVVVRSIEYVPSHVELVARPEFEAA